MKIIKSLEQLLYELMVWLVFYPLTLWRSVAQPLQLMGYADAELDDEDEDRYSDTLSPPIFLAITLGLVHLVELVAQVNVATDGLLTEDRNLIAFRLVAFALFPLMMSLQMLRATGTALDRKTLRPPFYAQCFLAAPLALGVDVASLLFAGGAGAVAGSAMLAAACLWYLGVQSAWSTRSLSVGRLRGLGYAFAAFMLALIVLLVLGAIIRML